MLLSSEKTVTASSQDANSISSDPLFIAFEGTEAANYQLETGSDCLNAALDLSAVFTTDYFGTTRPTGANTWDIGFYEYVAAVTTSIKSVANIAYASISKVAGVAKASINKIMGLK